jgi:hypothetical protein
MIECEEEHLAELQKFSERYPKNEEAKVFAIRSQQMLQHLKLRYQQYIDYCKKKD